MKIKTNATFQLLELQTGAAFDAAPVRNSSSRKIKLAAPLLRHLNTVTHAGYAPVRYGIVMSQFCISERGFYLLGVR